MKYGFITVAAATPKIRVGDPDYNAEQITTLCHDAASEGVKLLAFPELCVTGYTCGDLFLQSALLSGAERALVRIMEATEKLDLVFAVGVPLRCGGKLFNCAAVIHKGDLLAVVPKTYLPNYGEFYEQRWFTPFTEDMQGTEILFKYKGNTYTCDMGETVIRLYGSDELRLGVEICEDLWSMDPPSRKLAEHGANVIMNLSASNELVGKSEYRRDLVRSQSARLSCGYIYAGAGEGESTTDAVYSGHRIIAEDGVILEENRFSTGLSVTELDLQRLNFERRRLTDVKMATPFGEFMERTLETVDTPLTRIFSITPFVPEEKADVDERCREILTIQALGLKQRLLHTHAKTMVVGISGGLDSTLAMLVAVRAADLAGLPRAAVEAVTMPCFGTTERTKSNALLLAEKLGASTRTVDIGDSVKQHFKDIGHDYNNQNVVFENSQARERTQVLMDIANENGGLVIGTGDLSELALGWATYNGDHMSMYGVNAGVPKTLVRYLVKYCAETCGDDELAGVLFDILDTPVSPELLPAENGEISQKTEDLVGPYVLHDFFLYYFLRWGFSPSKIRYMARHAFRHTFSSETVDKWLKTFIRRFFSQQFKRSCLPDGPKVGSVSLSPRGDWRMPSDATVNLWLSELESEE